MIYDALDILLPRARFTATGKFWEDRPEVEAGGVLFNYEYVNPYSAAYKRLFGNIQGSSGETAIRTNDRLNPVENRSYVLLADGHLFRVAQVEIDYQSASKEAMRLFGVPLNTTWLLRLVSEDNPWGVR